MEFNKILVLKNAYIYFYNLLNEKDNKTQILDTKNQLISIKSTNTLV